MNDSTVSYRLGSGILKLVPGDITRDDADAIVNAANSGLAGGGGVDGAIHMAAGPRLLSACQEIIAKIGRLPAGGAVITPAFNLTARYVIHTVGPIWRGGDDNEEAKLLSAYTESIARAAENRLDTISFPAISTGIYRFPVELAAPIALRAMAKALADGTLKEIRLYLYGKHAFDTWRAVADGLFT
jgi:O-acetyl-ADP-ribose deacetylase (regulator of RNase III)